MVGRRSLSGRLHIDQKKDHDRHAPEVLAALRATADSEIQWLDLDCIRCVRRRLDTSYQEPQTQHDLKEHDRYLVPVHGHDVAEAAIDEIGEAAESFK